MPPNLLNKNCSGSIIDLIKRDVNPTILPQINFNSVEEEYINILIPHLSPDQVDVSDLEGYDAIVFFSHWQQQMYNLFLEVPYSSGIVMKNAIDPMPLVEKPRKSVGLLYVGDMDKGLDIVLSAFKRLTKRKYTDSKLVVCSKPVAGKDADTIIQEMNSNPRVKWYKSVDEELLNGLYNQSHIFLYPTNYPEVSYTPLIKAMSSGCMCIHSSYGSLPETALDLTSMYGYHEDKMQHTINFTRELDNALSIYNHKGLRRSMIQTLNAHKKIVDNVYNWKNRSYQWNELLLNFIAQNNG
jgi:glycosyltransferase involved in cell wall biosynthesis